MWWRRFCDDWASRTAVAAGRKLEPPRALDPTTAGRYPEAIAGVDDTDQSAFDGPIVGQRRGAALPRGRAAHPAAGRIGALRGNQTALLVLAGLWPGAVGVGRRSGLPHYWGDGVAPPVARSSDGKTGPKLLDQPAGPIAYSAFCGECEAWKGTLGY